MAYTTIDNPELHFQAKVYTADSSANRLITLDGSENMQPDWVWMKNRDQSVNHDLYDSVRGTTKYISSNKINAEATNADGLVGFNTDGFTVDTSWGNISTGNSYVAWCWKAGGSASSNSNGSITSSVSASTDAGFSIVSYNSGSSGNATIGHGLGSTPKMIITKSRSSSSYSWVVYHKDIATTVNKYLSINNTSATQDNGTSIWGSALSDTNSTTFGIRSGNGVVASTDCIAYCFAEKKGYSKFSSYVGNGSSDGSYIHLEFKPAWLLIKQSSSAGNDWLMYDNKRDTFNVANKLLVANASGAEATGQSFNYIDFLSNGFKIRGSDARNNGSGATYIYMAFAESPFVNSNGVPNNAR